MNDDFIIGPEPKWLTCGCGGLTARVPCWDCEACDEERKGRLREIAEAASRLPRGYIWAALGAPELSERVDTAELIEGLSARILGAHRALIHGPSGAGKTSLAIACLRERLPEGSFADAVALGTARIQHKAGCGEAPAVEAAMRAPLLLLDDIGNEAKTASNAVRDVVFARYNADLPTWVTTGLSSAQITDAYGAGMLRRLLDRAVVVKLGGGR